MATDPIIADRRPDANIPKWVTPAGCDVKRQSAFCRVDAGSTVQIRRPIASRWFHRRRGSACVLAVGKFVENLSIDEVDVSDPQSTAFRLRFANSRAEDTHELADLLECLHVVKHVRHHGHRRSVEQMRRTIPHPEQIHLRHSQPQRPAADYLNYRPTPKRETRSPVTLDRSPRPAHSNVAHLSDAPRTYPARAACKSALASPVNRRSNLSCRTLNTPGLTKAGGFGPIVIPFTPR